MDIELIRVKTVYGGHVRVNKHELANPHMKTHVKRYNNQGGQVVNTGHNSNLVHLDNLIY